jgi:hypothetical protein
MPAHKNIRKKIPKFSRSSIKTAELCCKALWYGINFENGNTQTSDEEFLNVLAMPMYEHAPHKRLPFKPAVFIVDVQNLMKVGKVTAVFRMKKYMDFTKAIKEIEKGIFPIFFNALKNPHTTDRCQSAIKAIAKLSDGIVTKPNYFQLVLSSRILFFLTPSLMVANMNRTVARNFGLRTQTQKNYADFQLLFKDGLKTNQNHLNRLELPKNRNHLAQIGWDKINETDWWQRRVLDIAVLLHLKLATPTLGLKKMVADIEAAFQHKEIDE